ncbi:MAG: protein kinase [Gemmataceae bacterium]|nr:protein kinase [Gemmataceae bacterium]
MAAIEVEDPALAQRVRLLLLANDTTDSLLDMPADAPFEFKVGVSTQKTLATQASDPHATRSVNRRGAKGPHEPRIQVEGFEIGEVLGRGGMSVVYKAEQLSLKRTVALKMMLAGAHAGPDQKARFRIEAEAVARLQHPNIVQIHEVGESGGYPYCALEYVAGGTLAERLGGKPMPAKEAAKLVETLARAMQLAHSRNVVHRDLKPSNIMMTADGIPKITDFGLARQLDRETGATHTGLLLGTPSYMAPEQASGYAHEAGPAADVYALGAILYDCLTGRAPFGGSTLAETLDQVRSREPEPPSRRVPGVPVDLETICLKCLRKESENRYASALELAAELARFQNNEPILARPVGRIERAGKWVKRNPVVAASLAFLVSILVCVTLASLIVADQFRDMANVQAELAEKEKNARIAADEARDVSRRELYHAETTLVLRSTFELGSIERLSAHAKRWEPRSDEAELRGWEWQLVRGLSKPLVKVNFPLTADAVANTSDGRNLIVNVGRKLTLIDLETGVQNRQWIVPDSLGSADSLQQERSGDRIAISKGTRVGVFDTENGTTTWERPAAGHPRMAWVPNSNRVAYLDRDGVCRIADADTGAELRSFSKLHEAFAFSPDGRWFATVIMLNYPTHGLQIWKTEDWSEARTIPIGKYDSRSISWSPDGNAVAVADFIGQVFLIDPASGAIARTLEANGLMNSCLAWRPDGRCLAAGDNGGLIRVWETDSWEQVPLCRRVTGTIHTLGWRADGTELLARDSKGNVHFWPMNRRPAEWSFHFGTKLSNTSYLTCAWHPDGKQIAGSGAAPGTIIWGADGLRKRKVSGVEWQWSDDGKLSASVLGEFITVWDADGTAVARVELVGQPKVLAWQPQNQTLAIRTADRISLWKPLSEPKPLVVSGGAIPKSIDFRSGGGLAWSPDGRQLAFGVERSREERTWEIQILNLADREVVATHAGRNGQILALAWSPDGRQLAVCREEPNVSLYDAATGRMVRELTGHGATVNTVAWLPDGTRIATGSADGLVKVWDSLTGRATVTFDLGSVVRHVAWSRNGSSLAAAAENGMIRAWDIGSGKSD